MLPTGAPALSPDSLFEAVWRSRTEASPDYTRSSLVEVSSGTGIPLFVVHWGSGNVRFVRHAIGEASGQHPVYGLQAIGLSDQRRPLLSVAEMAEHYLRLIQAVQTNGPYFLVGLCSGSHIAYEIARRIAASGNKVGLLAVINGLRPGTTLLDPDWGLSEIFRFRLESLERQFGPRALGADLPKVIEYMKVRFWLDEDAGMRDFFWHQLIWSAGMFAQERFRPSPYGGPIQVFRSARIRGLGALPWSGMSPQIRHAVLDADDSVAILRNPVFAEVIRGALAH